MSDSKNTFPVVVGITKKNHGFGSASRRLIHDFLMQHGMEPYMPQSSYATDGNLASGYTPGVGITSWSEVCWNALRLCENPMVYHLGGYWLGYGNTNGPTVFRWKSRNGGIQTLATCSREELSLFWSDIARQMDEKRVSARRWVMIDEPPATGKYGLTPEIEALVKKVVEALVEAGWIVGICVPGPNQFAYWRQRICPTRWLLGAKHTYADYVSVCPRERWGEVWLYNRTAKEQPMEGLAEQLVEFGAGGYLHWSADVESGTKPLLEVSMRTTTIRWTEVGKQLLAELEKVDMARKERQIDVLVKKAQDDIAEILRALLRQVMDLYDLRS